MRVKCILIVLFALLLCAGTLLSAQQAQGTQAPPQPSPEKTAAPPQGPSSAIVTQATDQTAEAIATPSTATTSQSEALAGYIDFGYRWRVSQNGSEAMYRTLVNLGQGPKFFGAHLVWKSPRPNLWDRFQFDSTGWGGEPYSNARVDIERAGVYDLGLQYRQQNYFSQVPSFANPLLVPFNYTLSQNGDDFKRRMADLDFTLFPNRRFSPFFSYSRTGRDGPGYWPWIGPSNEYLASTNFDDSTNLYRGGVHISLPRVFLTLEGGGTFFSDNQVTSFSGFNLGNRRTPLLGQIMHLDTVDQRYSVTGRMGFFRASFKAAPVKWADFAGQFGFSQASGTIGFSETATGQFVGLAALQTFTGLTSNGPGSALLPRPSGNVSMILRPMRRLRIVDSFDTLRFHNAASTVFTQTLTGVTGLLGTVAPSTTITTVTPGINFIASDYNRHQIEAIYELFPWISFRGGWRAEWSQWVQPSDEPGEFEFFKEQRNVALGGIDLRLPLGAAVNFSTEVGVPKKSLFRTSLYDYHKVKLGGRWNARPWLRFTGKYVRQYNTNDTPDISLYWHNHEVSFGVLLAPNDGRRFTISADWMYQNYSSDILAAIPFPPAIVNSAWQQNANHAGSFINVNLIHGASLNVGGSLLVSHGTQPTKYYQPRAELMIPIHSRIVWFNNWQYWDFNEKFQTENPNPLLPTLQNFNAHLFATGLRIKLGRE